jgi:4-hydroxy-tetrahydrodipicolinate synthase
MPESLTLEMTKPRFAGVMVPLVTPFDEQGSYADGAMDRLLDYVIGAGVHGVLVMGSTGEFSEMNATTRKDILAHAIAHVRGRVPVLAGIGANSTRETVELGHHAQSVGAAAALVVNPYYTPMSRDKLYGFYRDVAASVTLPVFIYNFPGMTGQDLEPNLVKDLAFTCENIVGIKDTVEAPGHTRQIIQEVHAERPDFMIFSGYDDQLLNALMLGGHGGFPATANFAPEVACGLFRAFHEGDYPATIALHRRIAALVAIYGVDTPSYSAIKAAMRLRGLDIGPGVLLPDRPLDTQGIAKVSAILKLAGISSADGVLGTVVA